ncbi:secreted phosphoprotein 24 isoform X4 [Micropterus salmoides]|uniref:secreted phosphoprotein 24 isoform X4 n=1 Tax=Micropterus salmoides TaxID=27706 RepID=UPI0018EB36AB|nr:secreted phosphoprotein 24 isoform X4 [Micropterus salmoides]
MKSYVLLLALLQSLGCSGIPLHNTELESMADRGLGAVLAEVNSAYAVSHLYRMTRGSVSRVIPVGLNTVDLLMKFGVKETECLKASRNDPQTCAFRPGFFVMFSRGRHQYNIPFANRVPAPSAPPPPIQPGRSFQSQTVEVRPRGDAFSNFLV